mmetsp:Transcript_13756/g.26668  ORF Transcript_13756/g.26668 Transcript_13756/m.26668 type:complete len:161 (+) Transcript_13756:148-630(+)|eukprot:CAMPEP_0171526838 /NCGR_PEP_ID=MMETSP0959-20130129/10660_1 /TAXON_ID=87120 /ORGANISM="Aurantiochytrium limacinum, Strain ATCCMYA-1381" /LENGTH=160 /DNA_ID=CAMNT_0012068395 /DNA_START=78 /DNA_END=560 /DNA_ORIENTATION=+
MRFLTWALLLAMVAIAASWTSVEARRVTKEASREEDGTEDEELAKLLKETDFVKMLEITAEKNDKKLEELHHRLESELARVNKHFEEMLDKIHESEQNIEKNLEKVELSVMGKVQTAQQKAAESQGSWKLPFIILLAALLGVAGYFARLYSKATKHSHFL